MDEPQPTSTQEAVVASWTPPPVTNFKVNVDGTIFSEQRAVGIGVVVRDDQGRVAATISKRINEHLWAVEAEAKAFEEGLQLAKDIGIQDFILEGDSLIIHRALSDLIRAPTSMDSLIVGMRAFYGLIVRSFF